MRAFKGFNKRDDGTLWCRDFKYDVGEKYNHTIPIVLCWSGFHACHELYQTWQFYPNNGKNVFYEVECGGEIIESEENDGKFVCSEIRIVKEIDMTDVSKFDFAWDFHEGFAVVILNEKYNFIDTSGKMLSEQWYDWAGNFHEGFALVELNGKYNFINTKGELLSEQWYDYANIFSGGFARVRLNDKYNFIDTEGKLLSERWYNEAYFFYEGFAVVKLDSNWYRIDKEGKIVE